MSEAAKAPGTTRFDAVVRGADVIDGTGQPRFRADVAISDGRIAAIGDLGAAAGDHELDAAGRVLAPGFIDVHTHDDRVLLSAPEQTPKASQGVSTVVVGNCGISISPLVRDGLPPPPFDLLIDEPAHCFKTVADYLERLDKAPAAINSLTLIGHTTLRYNCMDDLDRPANDREIEAMRSLLAEAMAAGAIGMSSGLYYPPARAASTEEMIGVAAALREPGGIYTAHIRDESDHVIEAIEEAAEIGRRAGVQVVISHHKTSGRRNFGRTKETLPLIERLRRHQPIGLDVYPYIASSTVLLPEMIAESERVIVTWSDPHPDASGRDLDDIAASMGLSRADAAAALSPAGAVYFQMHEDDVRRVLSFAHSMIGSDGLPSDRHPHPRLWGTFARVLGHYSRELNLFSLEEAVHRMTGLPAQEFGLADRGVIAPGNWADLVLFDPETVADTATFAEPKRPARGIDWVMVNGLKVWQDGKPTGERPGRAIRLSETGRGGT